MLNCEQSTNSGRPYDLLNRSFPSQVPWVFWDFPGVTET